MTAAFADSIAMSKIALTKRRKIYATSEERKQRNRQAQAAFRERRTEYIKQLESTIKHHEETLQNLQNSHRNAADECLMLRYKNSLLERVLLEKGSPRHLLSPAVLVSTCLRLCLPISSLALPIRMALTPCFIQALTSRPSCARRLAVQTWGPPEGHQRLSMRLQIRHPFSSVPC